MIIKEKNLKNNVNGITLIALVITIILLLILAGIVLNLTLGENGIIKKAETAGKSYENKAIEEENMLAKAEDYISSYRNDNSFSNLEGTQMILLTTLQETTQKNVGTYGMKTFTRNETKDIANYLEYDSTNNYYRVKKSGWYIIDQSTRVAQANGYTEIVNYLYLNSNETSHTSTFGYNSCGNENSKSLTVYLTKNDTIYFQKMIANVNNDDWNECISTIYVMDKVSK